MTLYDSETNDYVTAEDLGVTDEEYEAAIAESESGYSGEGHVLLGGRRVYAQ